MPKKEKILIIDSHALIHRAYHALPPMTSPQGENVNAVYGFASVLLRVIKELKPDYIVTAFDSAGKTFRHEEFVEYKAKRPMVDDDLINQFPKSRELAEAFGIPVLAKTGYEADDIIGTVVEKLKNKKNLLKIIVTGDLDSLQLVDDENILVYTLKKGVSETITYNEEAVKTRFEGLLPNQMIDYKGLKGDPSDNIPGVKGIGEKTAIQLLQKFKTLEGVYKNLNDKSISKSVKEKLEKSKDIAFLSKKLATIDRNVPIEFDFEKCAFDLKNDDEIKKLFFRLGFKSLVNRINDIIALGTAGSITPVQTELIGDELEELYKNGVFSEKIYKIEKDLRPVLRKIEKTGFLLDVEFLKKISVKISLELEEIKKEVIKIAGVDFNLNSTHELGKIIFEKLELGGKKIKKTKTGIYSTASDELEKIKGASPIIPLMLKWREFSKINSTYIDALPRLVSAKDGRIHTTFKQFGAITGRLSSENPNLQNIPTKGEYGLEIRKAFIAPKGYLILSADYSQIELRIAAVLSQDSKMIETFKRGEDIHSRTAAEIFNVPIEKVTKEMRREAKTLNFGVLYGMGARAFAQSSGISFGDAQEFIHEYESDFAGLAKFMREMKEKAKAQGYVETLWGRKRYMVELNSPNPGIRSAGERMAINMPIQGTAADIIKSAMVFLDNKIGKEKDINMILQVHDELVFEVKKEFAEKYAKIIKEGMENVAKLSVPIDVEVEVGDNWGELNKLSTK
jgi:DNA polymerase I-like protein with 3'-5' exonuclease and polymerase domains/5'-3' exonuclease